MATVPALRSHQSGPFGLGQVMLLSLKEQPPGVVVNLHPTRLECRKSECESECGEPGRDHGEVLR